jgi:hypothetical protein
LVTWKESFGRISTELDLTERKKQALENLHSAGRVSQFAFECLNKELTDETEEIETRRKALAEKMTGKLNELEEQRMALEMFLANTEMAYAAGEISDEIHTKESSALDMGLEATKQELSWIKDAIIQLVPKETETSTPTTTPIESAEVAATEPPAEKASEESQNAQVEVPVEVTANITEVKVEEIQTPTATPAETQATTGEPGEGSFRQPSEETPK